MGLGDFGVWGVYGLRFRIRVPLDGRSIGVLGVPLKEIDKGSFEVSFEGS